MVVVWVELCLSWYWRVCVLYITRRELVGFVLPQANHTWSVYTCFRCVHRSFSCMYNWILCSHIGNCLYNSSYMLENAAKNQEYWQNRVELCLSDAYKVFSRFILLRILLLSLYVLASLLLLVWKCCHFMILLVGQRCGDVRNNFAWLKFNLGDITTFSNNLFVRCFCFSFI